MITPISQIQAFINPRYFLLSGVLPEQIGELKKLETLNVSSNQLTTFPASLSSLKSLKTVIASHNRFVAMPVIVYTLRNLDVIDLSNCKITSVPDGINEIQAIEINLNQNQVSVAHTHNV